MMRATARWRDPALRTCREIDLPQGRVRCFEAGTGPAIVFVHGLFVNANVWRKVTRGLRRTPTVWRSTYRSARMSCR